MNINNKKEETSVNSDVSSFLGSILSDAGDFSPTSESIEPDSSETK
ncbi:hypothetical protein [Enterococcus ureasiticus]